MRTISIAYEDTPGFHQAMQNFVNNGTHVTVWGAPDGYVHPRKQMNYDGPGIYEHYKGGLYEVIGTAIREATYTKPCPYDTDGDGDCGRLGCPYCGGKYENPVVDVIYKPLSPGSVLEGTEIGHWSREWDDFNARIEIPWEMNTKDQFDPPQVTPLIREIPERQYAPRFRKLDLHEILKIRNDRLTEYARFVIHDMIGNS